MGLGHPDQEIEVVAAFTCVEDFLKAPRPPFDVVMLDLQLDSGISRAATSRPASGTQAIRMILDDDRGPIVIYTTLAEEMLLAACLAAGTIGEVVRLAMAGKTWVDPLVAGALQRWGDRRHAGALSPQQANALRYRGQGLTQLEIARRIGVSDPESVYRYLRAAVEKLADPADEDGAGTPGRHPGAIIDDLARRSGLADDLVRHIDLPPPRGKRRGR
jgi:DNA-binding NarL/FixJ family response regulator